MATVIKIKNSSVTAEPADNALAKGELAYSYSSNKLFIGQISNSDIVATPIGGKAYTDLIDTANKQFTATTITNDNTLTIQTTANNGNIVLTPHGTGTVDVSSAKITSLGTPTANTDAATKAYVDSQVTAQDLDITDGTTTSAVDLDSQTLTIQGTANEATVVLSGQVFTVGLPDDVTVAGDLAVNGGDLTTDDTTFNLINATAETINFGGAGTAIAIGAATGTTTITHATTSTASNNGALVVSGGAGIAENLNVGGNGVITGDLAVNGGDLTTTAATFNLLDTTASTINFGGAATTVDIGASSGTTTINNNAVVAGNLTVNGTTTTVNSNTVTIDDPIFTLGGDTLADQVANYSTDTKDRGIEFKYSDGTPAITAGNLQDGVEYVIIDASGTDFTASPYSAGSNDAGTVFTFSGTDNGSGGGTVVVSSALKTGFFGFDNTDDKFKFLTSASNTSEVFSGTAGDVEFGDIEGSNLTLTGNIASVDGGAPSAGELLIGTGSDFQKGSITHTTNTGVTVTSSSGAISVAGNNAGSTATVDPFREIVAGGSIEVGVTYEIITPGTSPSYTTDYANATGNAVGDTFTRATGEPTAPVDAVLLSRGGRAFSDDTTIVQADLAASAATNTSKGVASFASEQFNVNSGHVVVVEIDGGAF
jgi:fibronectin-binding autotransporter adhesin